MASVAASANDSDHIFKMEDIRSLLLLSLLLLAIHGTVAYFIPWDTEVVCNDDWAYTWACQQWYEHGALRLHPSAMAWALPQIGLANFCCLLFGSDSGQFLRGVGVLIGVICTFVIYATFRFFGDRPRFAFGKSALLAVSPLIIPLSWSFMTDVMFLLLILVSVALIAWAERSGKAQFMLLAGVAVGLVTLQRQYGLALILIPLVRPAFWQRGRRWVTVLGMAIPFLFLIAVWKWLDQGAGNASGLGPRLLLIVQTLIHSPLKSLTNFGSAFLQCLAFISLFWLPYELLSPHRRQPLILAACGAAFLLSELKILYSPPAEFGFAELDRVTWAHFYGLGLVGTGLHDAAVLHFPRPGLPDIGLLIDLIHILSLISGTLLLSRIIESIRSAAKEGIRSLPREIPIPLLSFLLLLSAVVSISVLSNFFLFDRYLLICIALAGFIYHENKRSGYVTLGVQWAFIVGIAIYAIAGTVDYWSWSGARFRLIDQLIASGVDPQQIDGGYGYHGLKTPVHISSDGKVDPNWETYWAGVHRPYCIDFNRGEQYYFEMDRIPFQSPFYHSKDSVLHLNVMGAKTR